MKWTEVADIFYLLHDHWELAADGSSFNSSSLTSTVAGFVFLEGKGGGGGGNLAERNLGGSSCNFILKSTTKLF